MYGYKGVQRVYKGYIRNMMGSRVLVVLLLQRLDRLRHTRHLFLERVKHLVALIERTLERVELLRVH